MLFAVCSDITPQYDNDMPYYKSAIPEDCPHVSIIRPVVSTSLMPHVIVYGKVVIVYGKAHECSLCADASTRQQSSVDARGNHA